MRQATRILRFKEARSGNTRVRTAGGWYVVVMEKIDEADFHGKGLVVHGGLRLANFVFAESDGTRKMLLVDFDWGGKEGVAAFPPTILNDELGVQNSRILNRKITFEHD